MKRILLLVLLLTNYVAFAQSTDCKTISLNAGYSFSDKNVRVVTKEDTLKDNLRLAPPNVSSATEPYFFCPGSTMYLTASLTSTSQYTAIFDWQGPNNIRGSKNNLPLININQSVEGEYFLRVKVSRAGCTDTTLAIKKEIKLLIPSVRVSESNVCVGNDLKMELSGPSDIGYENYALSKKSFLWTGPNNFTSTEASPTIKNVNESGIYTVIVTFSGFCVGTSQTTTKVNARKESSVRGDDFNVACVGGTAKLKAFPTVIGATGKFIWKGPNGFLQEGQEIRIKKISEKDAGQYKVIAQFTGGCTNTDSSFVRLDVDNLSPGFENINEFCLGNMVRLPRASSSFFDFDYGYNVVQYQWTGPNGFKRDGTSPYIYNFRKEDIGYYNVEITVSGECQAKINRSFYLSPVDKPFLSIYSYSDFNIFQIGDPIQLKAIAPQLSYDYENDYHFYRSKLKWQGPDNFTSTKQSIEINNFNEKNAGLYTATLEIDGCKEKAIAQFDLRVDKSNDSKLSIYFDSDNPSFCKGSSTVLGASTIPRDEGTTYRWQGPNGFQSEGRFIKITNIDENVTGIYTVTAHNKYGSAKKTTSVSMMQLPKVNLQEEKSICEGGFNTVSPDINPSDYDKNKEWSNYVNNGTITKYEWTGPNSYKSASQNLSFSNFNKKQAGEYEFKVTFSGACEGVISKKIKINVVDPVGNWTIDKSCNGKFLFIPIIQETSSHVSTSYRISNAANQELKNPLDASASGVYTLETTFSGACNSKVIHKLDVKDARPFNVSLPKTIEACEGGTIIVYPKLPVDWYYATTSGYYMKWIGPDSISSTQSFLRFNKVNNIFAGTYKLSVSLIGECNETYEAETELIVNSEIPTVNFDILQNKQTITLENKTTGGVADYTWDFGNGQTSKTKNPAAIIYANGGNFTISLAATNACGSNSIKKTITIEKELLLGNETSDEVLTLTVSPNPSEGMVEIGNPNKLDIQLSIHAMDGKMIDSFEMNSSKNSMKYDFSNYPSGVYLIKCIQKNGQVRTRKIVINK